jgi:hypothetical protein
MTRRAAFTKAEVTRALQAVQAAGLPVARCEIMPDGRIVVCTESADEPQNALDAWKANRGRNAQRSA